MCFLHMNHRPWRGSIKTTTICEEKVIVLESGSKGYIKDMVYYLINIMLLTAIWVVAENKKIMLGKKRVIEKNWLFCVIASSNWAILSGFRHISIGADTKAYKDMFDMVIKTDLKDIFIMIKERYLYGQRNVKDPGYMLIEKIFQEVSVNYQLWLIAIALLFFGAMGMWIYRYSLNPYISYIIFSCLFYSFFAVTGLRQTIATALVVMIGTRLIEKKKLIAFLVVVIIAYAIHASAICFLPFYWLAKVPINKISLGIYWIVIGSVYLFKQQFLLLLQRVVGYESYQELDGAGAGIFLYLFLLTAVITTVFYKYLIDKKNIGIIVNATMIACIFSSLLLINPSMMRVVQYYSVFLMLLIPELVNIFKKQKRMIIILGVSLMCLFLIKNDPQYMFFWE